MAQPPDRPVSAAMLIMATTMFAPGLEIECKTSWIAGTGLTSGAVNLLLCWLWVPRFGAMGAASAMCCSATLQMLVIFSLSQRNYRVPHRWAAGRGHPAHGARHPVGAGGDDRWP